jgi:voltage-gated potassium channel
MLSQRLKAFLISVARQTPFIWMIVLLIILWVFFAGMLYVSERSAGSTVITSFGDALYWGIAALSTAGIANPPVSGVSKLVGGMWIIIGSVLFFGIIVATVTAYFMRPLRRPASQIVDTIEYNLEQLDDLSIEELDLLKETVDTLIENVERIKRERISR